jgi:hypothetical protein
MKRKAKARKRGLHKAVPLRLPEDYPWKVVQKVHLDLKEYLTDADNRMIETVLRNRDFDGYLALAEAWGLQSTSLTDASLHVIRAKYLLASLVKKFQFPSDKATRVARATEIFFDAEGACKLYNDTSYRELIRPETEWGVSVLHHARLFLTKLLGTRLPGNRELLSRSRHGPGATIGTKKGNTSQYHKYAEWPYSCTIDAFRYARFAIETDQRWFGALQNSYRRRKSIEMHLPLDMSRFWDDVIEVVDGNRITFVPKDARKERTIAIEPLLNLYLQLGVDGYIRRRLKRWGVDLDHQEKNQELARLGSVRDDEDSFVTVDLSAASDSLSTKLCESVLPREWYSYLMDLRSPCGELGKEKISYEKISSMGNGYTFALESAIFTALVYAVMKAGGGNFTNKEFAVYGDDIILRKRFYFQLVEALRLSGFKVNLEKTFSNGPIRESCGTDWFHGKPLRPVFLDKTPTSVMDLFCDYNRIKRILSLYWGVEESECLKMLGAWIPERSRKIIGPYSDEDFDSYIHTAVPRAGMNARGVYKYPRLIVLPRHQIGRSLHFRKLMHDLREYPIQEPKFMDFHWRQVRGSGSRFTVTSRNAMIVGTTVSTAEIWRDEYAFLPTGYIGLL